MAKWKATILEPIHIEYGGVPICLIFYDSPETPCWEASAKWPGSNRWSFIHLTHGGPDAAEQAKQEAIQHIHNRAECANLEETVE